MQSRLLQGTFLSRTTIHRTFPPVKVISSYFRPSLYPKYPRFSTRHQSQNHTTQKNHKLWNRCLKLAGKQAEKFKNKPFSYVIAFLFLHEITAILPLPVFFLLFHSLDWIPPGLPVEYLDKGSGVASRIFEKMGYNLPIEQVSKVLIDGAAAYACVKLEYLSDFRKYTSTRLRKVTNKEPDTPTFQNLCKCRINAVLR